MASRLPQAPDMGCDRRYCIPPHLSMEQCSSEPTAIYKRRLILRLTNGHTESIADLTGGFGVDFSYMAQGFKHATYVERQERLCEIARHNFPRLGLESAKIVCADGTSFLETMPHVQVIFLDPQGETVRGSARLLSVTARQMWLCCATNYWNMRNMW